MATAPEVPSARRRRRWRVASTTSGGGGGVAVGAGVFAAAATAAMMFLCCYVGRADAHGRLIEPPSRASMWRYGFSTPADYNDHELYCGGFSRQWRRNGGRCGVCGDAWDMPEPRPHEAGGVFGQGPVVRRWRMGSAVPIRVELTANHRGYFEFRLCPRDRSSPEATQACLDAHRLRRTSSSRSAANALGAQAQALRRTASAVPGPLPPDDDEDSNDVDDDNSARYYPEAGANRVFEMRYQLPPGIVCERCVLQWRYIAGNSWGRCDNGTEAVGCGPQEEFRACADVAIDGPGARPRPIPYPTPPSSGGTDIEDEYEEGKGEVEEDGSEAGVAEEQLGRALWTALATALGAALAAATALLLLYVYYYHAADVLKRWLLARRLRMSAAASA